MQNFSIGALWSQAWAAFKRNWITGIGLIVLSFVAALIPIVSALFSLIFQAVYVQWGLRASDSEGTVSFGSAFPSSIATYLKVIVGLIIVGAVPGIVFAIGYVALSAQVGTMEYGNSFSFVSFIVFLIGALFLLVFQVLFFSYPYWVVDRGESIPDSLGKAFKFSSQNLGKVVTYMLSAIGINLLGAIPCGLGLLVTLPLTWIAAAGLYRALAPTVES